MGLKIERKFLVHDEDQAAWRQVQAVRYSQAYLNTDPERTVQVRIAEDGAFLTVKGLSEGPIHPQFEYAIPVADAHQMLQQCEGPRIEKLRRRIEFGGHVWKIDDFLGANAGLIVAAVELQSVAEPFAKPSWIGDEITGDARYDNANLITAPYKSWTQASLDIELKACPFCGNHDSVTFTDTAKEKFLDPMVWVFHLVHCDAAPTRGGCGAQSGWYDTPEEAGKGWNKRFGLTKKEIASTARP